MSPNTLRTLESSGLALAAFLARGRRARVASLLPAPSCCSHCSSIEPADSLSCGNCGADMTEPAPLAVRQ